MAAASMGNQMPATSGAHGDTFVFPPSFGPNAIHNFTSGVDVLQLSQSMFASVAAVLSDAQQVGSNVTVAHDALNVVTQHNTLLSTPHASDFHII
jgi:hypothetical protein